MRAFGDDGYQYKKKGSTVDELSIERGTFVKVNNDFSPCINEVISYISDFLQINSSE